MVAGAAAILFGADPELQPGQVARLLVDTARPLAVRPAAPGRRGPAGHRSGARAPAGRDASRRRDFGEPNERPAAASLPASGRVAATIDWYDDPEDLYRATLSGTVTIRTTGLARARVDVEAGGDVVASGPVGRPLRVTLRRRTPVTILVTAAARARGAYELTVTRR